MRLRVTAQFYENLFSWVQRGESCWTWTGATAKTGYGVVGCRELFGKQTQLVHRVMYLMYKGELPRGYQIDHLCKNRLCVNPSHLQAVPPAVNTRRGKAAKLTGEQVREIRTKYLPGITSQTELAKE